VSIRAAEFNFIFFTGKEELRRSHSIVNSPFGPRGKRNRTIDVAVYDARLNDWQCLELAEGSRCHPAS